MDGKGMSNITARSKKKQNNAMEGKRGVVVNILYPTATQTKRSVWYRGLAIGFQ